MYVYMNLCISRYVFGVTHVPRLEDWPVMPVERIGFSLLVSTVVVAILTFKLRYVYIFENLRMRAIYDLSLQPHGFFNCSPAIDVPPPYPDTDIKCHNGTKTTMQGPMSKL